LREKSRRPAIYSPPGKDNDDIDNLIDRIPDSKPSPGQEQTTKELRQKILEAVNRLPPEYSETFYLKEFEDLSYAEIGQILGCRIGTIKSRIFRARELLQQELAELYNEIK
jgi:RNA polymerase sigma factor (sigma-70 family)